MVNTVTNYEGGRAASALVGFLGWVTAGLGVIFAIVGFSSAGNSQIGLGLPTAPISLQIIAGLPGISLAIGGLISAMAAQIARASFDTADMTRQILKIAENGFTPMREASITSNPNSLESLLQPIRASGMEQKNSSDGVPYKVHKGVQITRNGSSFYVEGNQFKSEAAAERFIEIIQE